MARFEADIRAFILDRLPCSPAERAALEAERESDLLIVYFNWLERMIKARPRRVHISQALKSNPLRRTSPYLQALDVIQARISDGLDLTPHLSRGIRIGFEAPTAKARPLKRRRDLDLLLSDWGLHHLHLSIERCDDGFVRRTQHLLLGAFHADDAYLVDIIDHGDWSKQTLMETVVREWPDAGILYEMKGVTGLARSFDVESRKQMREAGVNVALEIDGKVYMSPGGIMSAGTSFHATRRAIEVRDALRAFCASLEADPGLVPGRILRSGGMPPRRPDLRFVFLEDGFGVLEKVSRTLFRLR